MIISVRTMLIRFSLHFPKIASSSICKFTTKLPLIQNVQSPWPNPQPSSEIISNVPARTIPDESINISIGASFDSGNAIFYPHLKFHPADLKVTLTTSINDLGLTDIEKKVFIEMVGKRYNSGKREVKLITNRFPNRIENKKYLIYLLEMLKSESKRLGAMDLYNL